MTCPHWMGIDLVCGQSIFSGMVPATGIILENIAPGKSLPSVPRAAFSILPQQGDVSLPILHMRLHHSNLHEIQDVLRSLPEILNPSSGGEAYTRFLHKNGHIVHWSPGIYRCGSSKSISCSGDSQVIQDSCNHILQQVSRLVNWCSLQEYPGGISIIPSESGSH